MIKFNKKDRENIFLYLIVPFLVFITLFISLSPWFLELLATPSDRVFSGINRWSTDYFVYLSDIEQARKGFLAVKLLLTTAPQQAIYARLSSTIPAFVLGHIFGLNNIFIYHFVRSFYGMVFLITTVFFFYKLSKSKMMTIIAFILTFYVSGFVKVDSFSPFQISRYLAWLQEQNIIGRATGPIHYSTGFIVFITGVIYFFYSKARPFKKMVVLGLLLNLLLLTNPFNYQLMVFCLAAYSAILVISHKKTDFLKEIGVIVASGMTSLPLLAYFYYHMSIKPWGPTSVTPKFYVVTTPPISFFETAMSVGPIFFLGIIGAAVYLFKEKKPFTLFLIIWPVIQFIQVLFGNQLKIHPPRAFSGLYYLPLAFFSAYLIIRLGALIKKQFGFNGQISALVITFLLFMITLPNYYLSYKEHLYAFTDFKNFQPLSYPSKNQVEAYSFLEKNTPPASGVLAMFEASSQLMAFSGNSTELAMDHATKVAFYSNQMGSDQARKFLKNNYFNYVYFGYQEQSVGGDMGKYPFLKKIYSNSEASVYRIE